ncbi:MAG TPA: hypothetical protein VKS79_16870 [Gemmataceae bacterium]|nr:hypothetical protein [Gemmataceae bacterium]
MPAIVECPSCGKKLKVPDEYIGKKVRCSDCNGTFVSGKPPAKEPPRPAAVESEPDDAADQTDDDAPVRRRSRSSMEPDRGVLILILGIAGSAGIFVIGIIAIVPAILAWIWGKADLKKMDEGTMSPDGRSNTQLGKTLGMVGLIVNAVFLVIGCVGIIIWIVFLGAVLSSVPKTPPPPAAQSNVPAKQASNNPFEDVSKTVEKMDVGSIDIAEFSSNTSKYKGKIVTLLLLVAEQINNKGSLKDFVGKDVKFAAMSKSMKRIEVKITIPDGVDVPKVGTGDIVKVTFLCKDGNTQRGNEAKTIEKGSIR